MNYIAHSANRVGRCHALSDHLSSVGALASKFVGPSAFEQEARLAGLLHDVGKYGDLFQRRLQGMEQGLDHWSQGAWLACVERKCVAAALVIQGHHVGLQSLASLYKSIPRGKAGPGSYPDHLRLSEPDPDVLKQRFLEDELICPVVAKPLALSRRIHAMLDARRLFSALVDADFLDTEAHFEGDSDGKRYRPPAPDLQAGRALEILQSHIAVLAAGGTAHPMQPLRDALLDRCGAAAANPRGLYTLTAPTGSGKTLAMLAFALGHAARHGMRRVVMVIPYLTIIEQTASIYRGIFAPHFGDDYVLEHHSLAGLGAEVAQSDAEGAAGTAGMSGAQRRRQQQTENWDAPLIVTTSVQMLESLFSNRPSVCRKLHRLADSVILFDEVQTLPTTLAVPTLAALSHLVSGWDSTVVFATATQPAFDAPAIHGAVVRQCAVGWKPAPLIGASPLTAPSRVNWEWQEDAPLEPQALASRLVQAKSGQTLSVLNTKQQARDVFSALRSAVDTPAVRHLSTNLCPLHREAVLKDVRQALADGTPVHLVATQCIEAGVDLDFPEVWRAFAPLDALIQAAGRCNRNGRRHTGGRMVVFRPQDNRYPDRSYEQAADAAGVLLKSHPEARQNPESPSVIRAYYELLYSLRNITLSAGLDIAIKNLDFAEVARQYRLIRQDAINVLVPYPGASATYEELRDAAERRGIQGHWMRRARGLTVSMFRPKPDDTAWDSLVPLQDRQRGQMKTSEDWFTVAKVEHYHPDLGLNLPKGLNHYIA
jgi:CRISPR-associated helicase Cas3/CRISPR-associated endonuclease Cas3-HD